MARSSNQKLKLMYIADLLLKNSDEENVFSMADIISYLASNGISAERKGIYNDMELLRQFGLDIIFRKEEPSGYYIGSREFELAELKLLVDAVWSSKFITDKKSKELIRKINSLTSKGEARKLERQVVVAGRIKSMNESIYYNVDKLHEAIGGNRMVSFKYYEWLPNKHMEYRKNGARYLVSPWTLYWSDENYYLIAYDHMAELIKYYRVDKMDDIEICKGKRLGREAYASLVKGDFTKTTFNMFAGREETVTLIVANRLAGVIIDRFGKDVFMHPYDKTHFKASVRVSVSNQFFGWLAGLSGDAYISSPENVAEEFKQYLTDILKNYQ